ncbi:hypothetical protein [Candidatus Accumulibacter sp. ACC003]|uniref:hypothetical protein n=1 Tax=Candidatus Accumulibacter sp. ACC003 TaxID=2823334 RepID=UPI0025BE487D|nr:hypothetical protein [Candidatus Accumulibacter sp. ACC003]
MSITPIDTPLAGEQVVGLAPENAAAAGRWWLRRPNLFAGRTLTGPTLAGRQDWAARHIALRAQAFTPGVVRGLESALFNNAAGLAATRLALLQGQGLSIDGEDLRVLQALEVALADLPAVADPAAFAGMAGVGGEGDSELGSTAAKVVGPALGAVVAALPDALPRVGIVLLQPLSADRIGEFDATDPCSLDGCGNGNVIAFEDWRIGDAARLLWYAWPEEFMSLPTMPAGAPGRWRNDLAWRIFDAERLLGADQTMPWEVFGVPIALVACASDWTPLFLDRASVVRHGGRARYGRMGGAADGLAIHWRLPALWQARFEQLAEQIAAAGEPIADAATLAADYARLPPFGLLPAHVVDLETLASDFFPASFTLDAAPLPTEQLDAALAEAASLAPLDLALGERVRLLVPVPQSVFEPRLLIREVIDPEFATTLAAFQLQRSRLLGARQGLRTRASVLARAISGKALAVPAIADDADALEVETLAPWGPPPAGGGHRSGLLAGVHQHFFEAATETLSVAAGEQLFAWVYLNPDHPPRTLLLQWHAESWNHRAYWGENLIDWGADGSVARAHAGELPTPGEWVQLRLPAALVGVEGLAADGMAFTLYDGQAAFAMTGAIATNGAPRKWFCSVLPTAAQQNGDERWDFMTHNDLWAPFDASAVVLPVDGSGAPAAGGHAEPSQAGLHQHWFENANATFTATAAERLYVWVFVDPNNPPAQLMLQWRSGTSWEHRAYWGLSRISWGVEGSASRRRIGALPRPGRWQRLEVPVDAVAGVDVVGAALNGMAFSYFDGSAAFGSAGALSAGNVERPWFAGAIPAGAQQRGSWQVLQARDLRAPTSAAVNGQVEAALRLYDNPALGHLSAHERYQIFQLGVAGFIAYLKSRADRADDLVDYNFVKVQTDIYRVRQLVLGTTAATRLAVSPALASIAQAETAVASSERIAGFFDELKNTPAVVQARSAAPAAAAAGGSVSSVGSISPASAPAGARALNLGSIGTQALLQSEPLQFSVVDTSVSKQNALVRDATSARLLAGSTTFVPFDITNAAPLIGRAEVRTVSIAERLEAPKANEAKDYTTATRYEAVRGLIALADTLETEDGGDSAGLFDGVAFHGVRGDPALFYESEDEVDNPDRPLPVVDSTDPADQNTLNGLRRSLPLRTVLKERWRLSLMLQAPRRSKVDESAYFSDGADLSDNTVALMRQLEGRIKLYRNAITLSEALLDSLRKQAVALEQRLLAVGEDLAEARHDVSVTRALIAEEDARLAAINDRRAQILRDHVKFVAYQRPREAELISPAPSRQLDPGLLEAPVPACLMAHQDAPDELAELLAVLREAPSRWFAGLPALLDKLDRVDLLVKTMQSAQLRSQIMNLRVAAQPPASAARGVANVANAIVALHGKQFAAVQQLRVAATRIDPQLIATLGWQGARAEAEKLVSLGDLIDGEHGSGLVASRAAALFENISRIAACMHQAFSEVLPAIRLDWAERLSQFDATPRLRNLAGLPRWGELDYQTRRQLQAYADWLFGQIKAGDSDAEALINDVLHMCLLLASHAPVNRIISGRLPAPVTAVPGVRLPIRVSDGLKLRVGMQALLYQGDRVVARARVDDLASGEVSTTVVHVEGSRRELAAETRVQFVAADSPVAMNSARLASVKIR